MPASTTSTKMKVSFYGHARQYHNIKREIDDAFHAVMESEAYVMGPALARFEKELAQYFGMKHAVGLNSGTDALWLAFFALGIQPGDEVITTANTFFATAEAIWIAGGKAVFVDSDPVTNNIDSTKIEPAITPRTVGIVPVHLYGHCADMKAVSAIAKKHKLWVVEDNAQSIEAHGDGFKQGELSDAVCISFIIQKNLGTFGDGGALITNRPDIELAVRRMRNHGSSPRRSPRRIPQRQAETHLQVDRSAPHLGQALHRRPQRQQLPPSHGITRLPARLPSLRHRTSQARPSHPVPRRSWH